MEGNRFSTTFGDGGGYVMTGDSITTEVNSFIVTARLEPDHDSNPHDLDDPQCCYYSRDPQYGHQNRRILRAWDRDEWLYVGVVLSVSKNGVTLDDHAASLWGVEANHPAGKRGGQYDNSYLTTVANELLDEALEIAQQTLFKLCAA